MGKIDTSVAKMMYVEDRLTLAQCAERLGCSVSMVWRILNKSGVDTSARLGSGRRGKSKGRNKMTSGYWLIYAPDHPAARKDHPYLLEHRLVMEKHLGRYLTSKEVVHHINGDRADNRIENLQLFPDHSTHMRETMRYGWARDWDRCQECGTTERRHEARGLCHRCHYRKKRGSSEALASEREQRWSRRATKCVSCGTTDRRHTARGMCKRCYNRWWDANR